MYIKPKANTLFHFTKSREVLKAILQGGFWPRYCLEDVNWLGYPEFDYIAYTMVCFCDIPLSRIGEHVAFYGEYGIGLTREWAERNGLNPVLYIAGENTLTHAFRDQNKYASKIVGDEKLIDTLKTIQRYILAHTKPTQGTMVLAGQPVSKVFYQESEWRYAPNHPDLKSYLVRSAYEVEDTLTLCNTKSKEVATLNFSPSDVRYIFVKNDSDIPDVIDFINGQLSHHSLADFKILTSRIVPLESLTGDL